MESVNEELGLKELGKEERLSRLVQHVEEELSTEELERLYQFGGFSLTDGVREFEASLATEVASRMVCETGGEVSTLEAKRVVRLLSKSDVSGLVVSTPVMRYEGMSSTKMMNAVDHLGRRLLVSQATEPKSHIVQLHHFKPADRYCMRDSLKKNVFNLSVLCGKQFELTIQTGRGTHHALQCLEGSEFAVLDAPAPVCSDCKEMFNEERSFGFDKLL